MNSNFIQALKEFFFDFIGFLVPGFFLLLVIVRIFNYQYTLEINAIEILVLSYVGGYFIFSITLLKEKIIEVWLSGIFIEKNKIIERLSNKDFYKLSTIYINKEIKNEDLKLHDYNSYRNYAMSKTIESDRKVYTFIFRAELFNQLHTISLLVVLTSIFLFFYTQLNSDFFNYIPSLSFIIIALLMLYPLRMGWKRFYEIGMKIPFIIYLAKIKENEKQL